jgi:hypothetical protein
MKFEMNAFARWYYLLPLLFGMLLIAPAIEAQSQPEKTEQTTTVDKEKFPEDDRKAAQHYYENYIFKPRKRSPVMWIVGFGFLIAMTVFLYFRIRQQRRERNNV